MTSPVEIIARALAEATETNAEYWEEWAPEAQDALDILSDAGLRIVPAEPTFEICSRGGHAIWDHASEEKHGLIAEAYRAMIAAYEAQPIAEGR